MDLDLLDDDQRFADRLQEWLLGNLAAGWREECRGYADYIRMQFDWEAKLAAGGWTGVWWPREYGGMGATPTQRAVYAELMARYDAPEGIGRTGRRLLGPAVMRFGNTRQRHEILPAILDGTEFWCQGYSEPEAGSDLAAVRTTGVLDGDVYRVNGSKIWTSEAQFAHRCFALVRTDSGAGKHAGLSTLLVDLSSPGIEIRPIMLMTGRPEFCEVVFTEVEVPASNLLGSAGQGWEIARYILSYERGAVMVFDTLVRIEKYLEHFAALCPGDMLSGVELGRSAAELAASRVLAYRMLDEQIRGGQPGEVGSLTKLHWSRTWIRMAEAALTTVGEDLFGTDPGSSAATLLDNFLECRRGTIGSGTSEIQRNIVAVRVLHLPAERSNGGTKTGQRSR